MISFGSRGHGNHAIIAVLVTLLTISSARTVPAASSGNEEVCDATADYFLGNEDYPESARLHRLIIEEHPNDALAHYHLGYAEGMMGQTASELDEYQTAARLGLKDWGLYLNLGRVYLEDGRTGPAIDAFRSAVALGPEHPESHFNLGLAYERQGRLGAASAELTKSLSLDPAQNDARNMLAVVDAEQGNYLDARSIWAELVRSQPNFAPAQANLTILDSTVKRNDPSGGALPATGFHSVSALSQQ
jgi:tetratricopeptide (TPR) repeat protein